MNSRPRRNYSLSEVRRLVENWEELHPRKGVHGYPLLVLCQLADLHRTLPRLSYKEREAVLVCGIAGLPVRAAEELLSVDHATAARRYNRALEKLTTYMNGDR